MNAVINVSIILAVAIMQLDNLFVCYKVTDLIQNENPDLYKHYLELISEHNNDMVLLQ
jgi:hypothetical protein